jgi:hypothetical protein
MVGLFCCTRVLRLTVLRLVRQRLDGPAAELERLGEHTVTSLHFTGTAGPGRNRICLSNSECYNTPLIECTRIYFFLAASAADPALVQAAAGKSGRAAARFPGSGWRAGLRRRLAMGADHPQVPPGKARCHQGLVEQVEAECCHFSKAPLVRWRPRPSASPRRHGGSRLSRCQQRLQLLAENGFENPGRPGCSARRPSC